MFWAEIRKISEFFTWKFSFFWWWNFQYMYLNRHVFVMLSWKVLICSAIPEQDWCLACLVKFFSRRHLEIFVLLLKKIGFAIHASCLITNYFAWNIKAYFLGKIRKKKLVNLSSSEFSQRMLQFRHQNNLVYVSLTLKMQNTTIASALASAGYFKSHCCKQCGPRSDCSSRSTLLWSGSTLFAYMQKVCLKSLQEDAADDITRQHFQMQVFLAF